MKDITTEEIRAQLDLNNPRWMFDLADATDLRDALDGKCRNPEFDVSEFLAGRCRRKIDQISQAVWQCLWKKESE